ncbi:FUSC family protein [Acinetobacter pittii]|uniref:FUSC family protein n=1 Tax=Acinetobacter pittii TaxID=48296 RepID=UPI00355B0A36
MNRQMLSPTLEHFLMPNKATLLFALKGIVAIGMALSIAMYLALDNPFWAAIPAVMLQARPHSGFVMEKALFLVASSLVGAVLAFLILDYFIHTPVLAIGLLTLIVAITSYFGVTVRHANFVFGLALIPITANMIVLFAISHIEMISSQTIFNIAFARVSEVMVGAGCAIFSSALLFPLRMKDILASHTKLLVTHLQTYLILSFDPEKNPEDKEQQLKILLGIIILINDDSSPSFYEHRSNMRRALYMINQSMQLIALTKSLNVISKQQKINPLLGQFKKVCLQQSLIAHHNGIQLIKLQLDHLEDLYLKNTLHNIFEIYENILLAELESQRWSSDASKYYAQRLKSHRDILFGFVSSFRVVVTYLMCVAIWVVNDGASSLLMMVILPILFSQMFVHAPNPSLIVIKLCKGALLSIPFALLIVLGSAASMTGYLEIFLLIFLPFLFIGLMAMTNPSITPYGLGFCFSMITLVQPSNHMKFAIDQSLVMGLSMALSMLITALFFQLIPKISPFILQKRIIHDIAEEIKKIGEYKRYSHEKFNKNIGEKLFFLSAYQKNTIESNQLFKLGILELLAAYILLNIEQELRLEKQSNIFNNIRDYTCQIFQLSIENKYSYRQQVIQELENILEKLSDESLGKMQAKNLVQYFKEI